MVSTPKKERELNPFSALKCLKPGSHCAILDTIWSSETNIENPKDSCNPRLKSVVLDRWFGHVPLT